MTKAQYLRQMYAPDLPDFPVPPEIAAHVPHDLPGELPETIGTFLREIGYL